MCGIVFRFSFFLIPSQTNVLSSEWQISISFFSCCDVIHTQRVFFSYSNLMLICVVGLWQSEK